MGSQKPERRVVEEPARTGNPFVVVPTSPATVVESPDTRETTTPKTPVKVSSR